MQWAYFQGFAPPEPLAEFPVDMKNVCAKPLKISPRLLNDIDVVLKGTAVTGYSRYLFRP